MSAPWITLPAPTLAEVDPDDLVAAVEQVAQGWRES
jgi:hypothetical protein